ncbi:MAG: 50S ribosomal protein L22 [Thaumarchaeota archaeon]|jgi:large subunit ribosomal protein L22|nr:50S ribosomal protein L22 [Nitrososphaerota archaeon]MCL7385971.1 50S ribosomal protein L22 [Candidatus Wolframiiraptor allenii]
MPHWEYSIKELDETRVVKASLREIDVSPKWSREVCRAIVGLRIPEAKKLMEDVIAMRRMIPYRRYRKNRAHHAETKGAGGYPVKVAKHMLKLLESLEANADFKGLDPDEVVIIHAAAHKARRIRKFMPRAFGRATPYDKQLVHIEVVGEVRR